MHGAVVFVDGIKYYAPWRKTFTAGTVLNISAFSSGYTIENRTVIVKDTSKTGAATQKFIFLLSAFLVRIYAF